MSVLSIDSTRTGNEAQRVLVLARRVGLAGSAGLAIGLGMSSIFAVPVLFRPVSGFGFVAAPIAATLLAGAAFAGLLARARRVHTDVWVRAFGLALVVCIGSLLGLLLPLLIEPTAISMPDADRLLVFRLAFVSASAAIAFVCTAMAALMFGVQGWRSRSAIVAMVTAGSYLVAVVAVDALLHLHVGAGNQAMPKVAALSNLAAGFVGGALAHVLLSRTYAPLS